MLDASFAARTVESDDEQSLAVRQRLKRAMDLSEADREIVELRHHGGLSFKQIADVLGEPMGTLLARHHRALKSSRKRWKASRNARPKPLRPGDSENHEGKAAFPRKAKGREHMTHKHTNAAESGLPADLEQIAALLDACGHDERSAPDAGFESRLAAATRPISGLRLAGSPKSRETVRHARPMGMWPMRIAAALALCGGLVAVREMATLNSNIVGTPSVPVAAATDQLADNSMDVAFALVGWSDECIIAR